MARHSLYLRDDLAADAKELGINITGVCQLAIRDAIHEATRPTPPVMPSDTGVESPVIAVAMQDGNKFLWEMSSAEADDFIREIRDEPFVQRPWAGTHVILRVDAIAWILLNDVEKQQEVIELDAAGHLRRLDR